MYKAGVTNEKDNRRIKKRTYPDFNNFRYCIFLGITREEGLRLLHLAKNMISDHLDKEDDKIYRTLHVNARNNEELQNIVDNFAGDVQDISKKVITFFDKYSSRKNSLEFGKDLRVVLAKLKSRISREENIFFNKILKLGIS